MKGMVLDGRWTVGDLIEPGPLGTGGHFSVTYRLSDAAGQTAFLKALNLERALRSVDPARAIEAMTKAFNFERDLLATCGERQMSKVVRALGDGAVAVNGTYVNYLIFEEADGGDIRQYLNSARQFDAAFAFRALHNVAAGLVQLHQAGIAHQDLKPSNVLVFEREQTYKVGDLGRASAKGVDGPVDDLPVPGDRTYAPPELAYGQVSAEWTERRQASDLYHLGSLLYFLFNDVSVTAALQQELDPGHTFHNWSGTFEAVLPYLHNAFEELVTRLESRVPHVPATSLRRGESASALAARAFRELCMPDPAHRGHPSARLGSGSPYSCQRYVSLFDLLARRFEAAMVGR
jgi:eukaryotic-like serine/threonine-protein kinase